MKLIVEIPREYVGDYEKDNFKRCFERSLSDITGLEEAGMSKKYDHETMKMLMQAFLDSTILTVD